MSESLKSALVDALNEADWSELVNEVIAEKLISGPISTAIAEAEARGYARGLEAAATHLEDRADYFNRSPGYRNWDDAARSYRASAKEVRQIRATDPAETQKPETGESHHAG